MKHLEKVPWFICDEGDTNFISYNDTDSLYVNAEPLVKHLYPDFEEKTDEEKDNLLESVALKYQDLINEYYDEMAKTIFNINDSHRFEMKTEAVIRAAYFRATRRYAQWITKSEGVDVDKLDIKGLEFMKANFPPLFGKFFNKLLDQVIRGVTQDEIDKQIHEFRDKVLTNLDPVLLGNPTSVKKLNSYVGPRRNGEILSSIKLGAPAPVKAAIRYNDLLHLWKLDKKYSEIVQGDKVKWVYLKPNSYKIETLAFLEFDIPDKIRTFMEEYVDRKKSFDTILLNKLEGFYSDLEWQLNVNPYIKQFFNF
ncbi:DNA polymerase domain-containing protein [Haliea sp.]|uniref:DNA polymerase domain-containing protein n=1 Tax=Haliea sp. TaxID=1932666 RepID=UPI002580B7D7|nr:DNA polymerase domain-containing protein [Haliea sp.]